jgi:anhydro-N-acetylmuramic acid kinase
MFYKAIGIMSGSSLDGLDIVFAEFTETTGKWSYTVLASDCYEYETEWIDRLKDAIHLNAYEYLLLHSAYGKYIGEKINHFIEKHQLHFQVQLIASHGHTTFHAPHLGMTAQLGDGAAIAAVTGINVISDLRAMDVALGGQGAPIVPMGEKLLWSEYDFLLNIGGIANISVKQKKEYIAYDVCPANRVLNMLANDAGKNYDAGGQMASVGEIHQELLQQLNHLDYYKQPYPKSLANNFGTHMVYPLIKSFHLSTEDALRTYTEHIALQVGSSIIDRLKSFTSNSRLFITGGGAHNTFLIECIKNSLHGFEIEVVIPGEAAVDYKEALVMALLGILRWREENTVLASVTGATRNSIGGAVWMGQQA